MTTVGPMQPAFLGGDVPLHRALGDAEPPRATLRTAGGGFLQVGDPVLEEWPAP